MKTATFSISIAAALLGFSLCLNGCGSGKTESASADSTSVGASDTMQKDSMPMDPVSPSSARTIDTTDTGGRNTQAPPPKK